MWSESAQNDICSGPFQSQPITDPRHGKHVVATETRGVKKAGAAANAGGDKMQAVAAIEAVLAWHA